MSKRKDDKNDENMKKLTQIKKKQAADLAPAGITSVAPGADDGCEVIEEEAAEEEAAEEEAAEEEAAEIRGAAVAPLL
ncbi:atp-dependent molecular chaperone hsc82 [Lasius niger]|uniref:Atp-dependent molecular chaperone hsc82 n=1 Tax=Lasius niger TaxID=67767 RepID=A0A0J7K5I8_LASNI|nr:atp-dependent molecular chaperone hsc82 [Lasius niger]